MTKEEHFRKLERMYHEAPTNEYYRPSLQIMEGRTQLNLAVRSDFFHGAGAAHGSVYFKALDDAAYFAVHSLVTDVFMVTASFTVYFARPISSGVIQGIGEVVHRSRNLYFAEARLENKKGKEIGRGSGTFVRSKIPLDADVGYG